MSLIKPSWNQLAKVRAAQKALDDAAVTAYTKGQGSPEGQAALASLPQLKKNLADALNDLVNCPTTTTSAPAALRASADGHFLFGYTADGQPVQVTGQLKNGTGEIFDQGTGTYYTFKDAKLVRMRDARTRAAPKPPTSRCSSAVTLAVGAPDPGGRRSRCARVQGALRTAGRRLGCRHHFGERPSPGRRRGRKPRRTCLRTAGR